jgi:hydrogenase expression/formation protein HypD
MLAWRAREEQVNNLSLLVSHVLVPPALEAILSASGNRVQGFLGPGYVCAVMGYNEYGPISERHHVPIVITGFEPIDILEGTLMTIKQLEEGRATVENQYSRVLDRQGNLPAQQLIGKVFEVGDRKWRGIGTIPGSGYHLRDEFSRHDAEKLYEVAEIATLEPEICLPRPADEVRRIHEEGCTAARRSLRLLLRRTARLRRGRPPARPAWLLGLLQRPRLLRLSVQEHG